MKHLLLTTIAAVVLLGCGPSEPPEPTTAKVPDIDIWTAAARGDIEAVKQHLAAGADVNAKDDDGWTPLHQATDEGHKEIVELLIAKGADVNATDEDGETPLDHAEGLRSWPPLEDNCLLYTSPSPRDQRGSRMPSSA